MSANETRTQESTATELTVKEAAGDCEVVETDEKYAGPFPEYDKYGNPTGCSYVRCRDCGREILTGRKEFATHRDGCRFSDESDESDDREEPQRHEPADFGYGESTGVQDL